MPTFLAPLFLAAAAAIAIPIIIHLRRREQRTTLPFPSLMFLRKVPHRSTSRRQIHQWPLLLLRILALVLIAAAFARPLLDRETPLVAAGMDPARELVILIDRSYSMGVGDRFAQAKQIALDTIATLRAVDRATIIAFDASARPLIDPTADRAALRKLVEGFSIGDGATRFAPAIKIAAGVLDASALPVRDALLISDMQRTAWDNDPTAKLPAGATLRTIAVSSPPQSNLAIADITLKRVVSEGRELVTPAARIVNLASAASPSVVVALSLDGRPAQTRQVTVPASGAANVEFDAVPITKPTRAAVTLPVDAVPADNERVALLEPGNSLKVLVVGSTSQSNLYLTQALALGDDPEFTVVDRAGGLAIADMKDRDVIVLNDVPVPAGPVGTRLREFIEAGGGLIVATGDRGSQARFNDISSTLLPGRPNGIVDRAREGGIPLGTVERSHPVFDLFRAPRSGDLLAPRFYKHTLIDEMTADSALRATSDVLARFGDGSAALLERRVGNGRVLLLGAPLDNYWSDLPVQPVYLPLMHRMLIYAAGWERDQAANTVGDVVSLGAGDYVAVSPRGKRITLSAAQPSLPMEERGFYEVRGADNDNEVIATIASNVDVGESDLAPLDAAELVSAVQTPAGTERRSPREQAQASAEERERRQSLWWYLLVAGFTLLAAETVISNWLSRRPVRREA